MRGDKNLKKYLIKMFPLEPYTFGSELGFSFKNDRASTDTYFMRSKELPEQTTVFGMVRYLLLKNENKLKSDFNYNGMENEITDICGKESFSFAKALGNGNQDFGYIEGISPVFLLDEEGSIFVKNPFCNEFEEKGFKPMYLQQEKMETSEGEILLPTYDTKKGHADGYICISAKKEDFLGRIKKEKDFFCSYINTGNMKNGESKDEALFRIETIYMNNVSFGVYLSLNEKAKDITTPTIVYMGTKRSAFRIEAEPVDEQESLECHIKNFFKEFEIEKNKWFYCLSDVLPTKNWKYENFGIVEEKSIRNLETDYVAKNQVNRYRRSQNQYNLISAGSVFFDKVPSGLIDENESIKKLKRAGYNYIIEIGGN